MHRARGSYRECLAEIWRRRVWLLFLARGVATAAIFSFIPFLQTELTDYFLRRRTDKDLDCSGHDSKTEDDDEPQECVDAHTAVMLWSTGRTIVSHLTLTLFFNAAVGSWSDMYGRKPFLLYETFMAVTKYLVVYLYLKAGWELYWYFLVEVVATPYSSSALILAFIADTVSETNRILAFGLSSLVFNLGVILGTVPTLAGVVTDMESACYAGMGLSLLSTCILLFFVPETVSKELQLSARSQAKTHSGSDVVKSLKFCWASFVEALKILYRTPLFRRLTLIQFFVAIAAEEVMAFRLQYLQEVIDFGTKEQANLMMIMGVSGFLILTVGLWLARPVFKLTDTQILFLGVFMLAGSFFLLATVQSAWMAYLSAALGSFWTFLSMAVSSIKANNVASDEQGAVQGALSSVTSIGFGLGPIIFFSLFYVFRHGAVYVPGAPFYFAFLLMVACMGVVLTLKAPAPQRNSSALALVDRSGEDALEREPMIS